MNKYVFTALILLLSTSTLGLLVEKNSAQSIWNRSDTIDFSVVVNNTGMTNLTQINISDIYNGSEFYYLNASITPNSTSSGILLWTIDQELAPNESIVINISFEALAVGNNTNNVNVVVLDNNSVQYMNASNATVEVLRYHYNLSVVKTCLDPVALNNSAVRFLINITNTGGKAYDISVIDTFDTAVLSLIGSSHNFTLSGENITWILNISDYVEIGVEFLSTSIGYSNNTVMLSNGSVIDTSWDEVNVTTITTGSSNAAYSNSTFFKQRINSVKDNLSQADLSWLTSGIVGGINYDQIILLGNVSVDYDKPGDLNDPILFLDVGAIGSDKEILYELEVSFESSLDLFTVAGETMSVAGKELTFSSDRSNLADDDFYMYSAEVVEVIGVGETTTVTLDGLSIDLSVIGVNTDNQSATISVDGVMAAVNEGEFTLVNGVDIYINDISLRVIPVFSPAVEIFAGADQIRFQDGFELEMNGFTVDGTVVDTAMSTGVDSFSIIVSPIDFDLDWANGDDIVYIPKGLFVDDPIFDFYINYTSEQTGAYGGIKLYRTQNDQAILNFTNANDTDISMYILNYGSDSELNFSWGNINIKTDSGTLDDNEYCILSEAKANWGITHVIQLKNVDSDSHDLEFNVAGVGTEIISYDEAMLDATLPLYGMTIPIVNIDEAQETIEINCTDVIYTKAGMKIQLIEGLLNTTYVQFNITEDFFSNDQNGSQFYIGAEYSTLDSEVDLSIGMSLIAADDSDDSYQYTDYGTYITVDVFNDDKIILDYPNATSKHIFAISSGFGTDSLAPSTSINYNANIWYSGLSYNITKTCFDYGYDGCNVTYYCIDSSNVCTPSTLMTSYNHTIQGTRYIRYYSMDNYDNSESVKSQIIMLDGIGPVTVDNIGTWVMNFTLNLSATDSLSGVDYTTFNVSGSWYNDTNFTFLVSGNYSVQYYSVDNVGNNESIHDVDVLIDNTIPAVPAYIPQRTYINTIFNFTWGASVDAHSGIASYLVQASTNYTFSGAANYTTSSLYRELTLSEGEHYVRVQGIDNVGLNSSWLQKNITMDMTSPVIDSTPSTDYTAAGLYQNVTINWNVTESHFDSLLYSKDGGAWKVGIQNSTKSYNFTSGYHTFRLKANDSATNIQYKTIEFHMNLPLNITETLDELKDKMNDSIDVQNISLYMHDNSTPLNGSQRINDTLNISVSMENITVNLNSFEGLEVSWNSSPVIDLAVNASINDSIADLGSSSQVMVNVRNVSEFITSEYDGEIVFNKSGMNYTFVYYCNGSCVKLTTCGVSPCYAVADDLLSVYVDSFSSVILSLDDIIGTVNITSPVNGSESGDLTFDFRVTESVRILNLTLDGVEVAFPTTTGSSFSIDLNGTLSDNVFANGIYNISVFLNDTYGNSEWFNYSFEIDDDKGPAFNITPGSTTYSNTKSTLNSKSVITSTEYANYTYTYNGVEFNTSTDLGPDKKVTISYTLVQGVNNLTVNLTDRNGNSNVSSVQHTYNQKSATSSDESSSTSDEQDLINLETKFSKSWSEIAAGAETPFEVSNDYIPVRSILFKLNDGATGVSLTVVMLGSKPSNVGTLDKAFSYMNIFTAGIVSSNVNFAKFSFRVPKSWLKEQGLTKDEISLYRNNDGWKELFTTAVVETELYHYYEATSDGFSYFAIAKKDTSTDAEIPETVVNNAPDLTVDEPVVDDLAGIAGNTTKTKQEVEEDNSIVKTILIIILLSALISGLIIYMRHKYRDTLVRERKLGKPKKTSSIYSIRLKYYINKSRKLGKTNKQIKKELIETGWPDETIDKYLK